MKGAAYLSASRKTDPPRSEAGPQANRNLPLSQHIWGERWRWYATSLHPSPVWALSWSFRRNLVCFAKSGQVDRLPPPQLIPAVIFSRCHCSYSPGSEPGFRCEWQARCQVLFAVLTRLEAPALTRPSLEAAHSTDVTQLQEPLAVNSSIYDSTHTKENICMVYIAWVFFCCCF